MKKGLAMLLGATMAVSMSVGAFALNTTFNDKSTQMRVDGKTVFCELLESRGSIWADIWSNSTFDYLEAYVEVDSDEMAGTDRAREENVDQASAWVEDFDWVDYYTASGDYYARNNGLDGSARLVSRG